MADIRVKDLNEASVPGADYYLLTDSATDGVKKVLTTNVVVPVASGVSGMGAGVATFLATPSSANLASALTDETGSGSAVFATSPTLVTPNLGDASATSVNKVAVTAPATGATLTIADGKTLTASGDADVSGTNTGDQTITLTGDVTGTGTGSFAATIGATKVTSAMLNSDVFSTAHTWSGQQTFVAPALGTPASGTATNITGLPLSTGVTGTLLAAQFPALTGDITTTAGALATTIAANAVTNAKAAQMAAYTIKGNATGSTANATDISIPALTQKASPAATDKIMIADSAASNALKYATISSIASAGSVSSIAGNTGAFTLSKGITNSTNDIQLALNNATFQGNPTNPTGTTSTTQVMAGLGSTCKITPAYSGRVMVQFQGSAFNSTIGNVLAQIRWGTGTAPSNGAAATGTTAGNIITATIPAATYRSPMALAAIVTGLTPSTAYWFDLGFAPNTGTGTIENISCSIMEF